MSEKSDLQGQTNGNTNGMAPLAPQMTTGSITITPEMFERMYLGPQNEVKGDLRRTFGNPTPVGLGGFLLAYCPLIISFLGWGGAGGSGAATVGTFYFMGGLLAILACIGEWILGNSFPSTFFGVYGGFFLYYGATLTPSFNATGAFAAQDPTGMGNGLNAPMFLASSAYVDIFMSLFSFISTICALRVNALFAAAFFLLGVTFPLHCASLFWASKGDLSRNHTFLVAAGSTGFPVIIIGWYLLLVIMLSTVDFPLTLPTGDLSTLLPSNTQLMKQKKRAEANGEAV